MMNSGIPAREYEEGEDSFWKVWLTRILVTVAIIFVFEYIGKQKVPQRKEKEEEKEDEKLAVTMQYAELSGSGTESDTANGNEEADDEQDTTTDADAVTTEPDDVNDEVKLYDELEEEVQQKEKEEEQPFDGTASDDASFSEDKTQKVTNNNNSNEETTTATTTTTEPNTTEPKPLKFKNKLNCHPGMDGYHLWYDIETSLFRQYNVGRTDGVDVIPPYVPKSRNGQIRVALRVTNHYALRVNVYWINYTGKEDLKGSIYRGETWQQTTYVEHPWVFRLAPDPDADTNNTGELEPLLLHYIPERVIPHLDEAPTIEDQHPMVGVQRFSIRAPTDQALREHFICSIDDPIMPHPAHHQFHNPHQAHNWTLIQMKRMDYFNYNPQGAKILTKYLTNIAMHPGKPHYRKIRIANKTFATGIWNTPARGLLLAAGFQEQHAYTELGTAAPLSNELVQDVSLALYRLEQCLIELGQSTGSSSKKQPEGADGQGRAGFKIR